MISFNGNAGMEREVTGDYGGGCDLQLKFFFLVFSIPSDKLSPCFPGF